MVKLVRWRFWVEALAAAFGFGAGVLTLVAKDWIEAVFPVSPDQGDGSLEWLLVAALFTIALVAGVLARHELTIARARS